MNEPYLAIADADKIHDYVFSPRELKMIRGGSAIQVELNYEDMPRLVAKNHGDVIYRGGGTMLAEFPSKACADQFCRDCHAEFSRKTRIATVSTARSPYDGSDFRGSLRRVRDELERNKQERAETVFNGGGPYWANCQGCGVHAAISFGRSDPSRVLCAACILREQGSQRRKNYPAGVEPPEDFEAIGAFSRPANYVALIYIDLDRLGKHLADWAETSRQKYKEVSVLIDNSVREAVKETCQEMLVFEREGNRQAAYEILLRGGDDAVLLTPASYGLRVLERFGQLYRGAYESAGTGTPTPALSAGVVIAHQNFPISDLLSMAEELLRSAKTLRGGDSVDFAVVSSSLADNPLAERKVAVQRSGGMYRTVKPYYLTDLMSQAARISRLKATAPASKVKALYSIAYEDVMQAGLEYLDLLGRLDEESKQIMLEAVGSELWAASAAGWMGTRAADIVELWDFCG
jgi:hypothetical protein